MVVLFALPLISSGFIIFRMLGAYVDSSGTLVPTLRVPLDFSVIECPLVLHSGTSGRFILLVRGRRSADDLYPLIAVVAGAFPNPNGMTRDLNCPYRVRHVVLYSSPSLIPIR